MIRRCLKFFMLHSKIHLEMFKWKLSGQWSTWCGGSHSKVRLEKRMHSWRRKLPGFHLSMFHSRRYNKGNGLQLDPCPLEVSLNAGHDFSSNGFLFHYLPDLQVLGIYPNHGPRQGGTVITVVGEHFERGLQCIIGAHAAVATVVNSTAAFCISPPNAKAERTELELRHDHHMPDVSFTSATIAFTYDSDVDLTAAIPDKVGTTRRTLVKVLGTGFLPTDELRCKFGVVEVNADYISGSVLICRVPPGLTPGHLELTVSTNAVDFVSNVLGMFVYKPPRIQTLSPILGPTKFGTKVVVEGEGFWESPDAACVFGRTIVPAVVLDSGRMSCDTPPLRQQDALVWSALDGHRRSTEALAMSKLFPDAHSYPYYLSKLVRVEVSMNRRDFTRSGQKFLYQEEASVLDVTPQSVWYTDFETMVFVLGSGFVNSTLLSCRLGSTTYTGTFVSTNVVACHVVLGDIFLQRRNENVVDIRRHLFVSIANNGIDFVGTNVSLEILGRCPPGFYCTGSLDSSKHPCPPGAFCAGNGLTNFTLCPMGTYQPAAQSRDCLRCPIGYACPEVGLRVPRVCPAGYVCSVTGTATPTTLCPEGHFCLEGTATTATTCGSADLSEELFPELSTEEDRSSVRPGRVPIEGVPSFGSRNSGCWSNTTEDLGLQVSSYPSQFWMERHMLPLDAHASFRPLRGRFCLDDSCFRLADYDSMSVADYAFDYASTGFALRRPVPCPVGMYCGLGTAVGESNMRNFSTPQPCYESMYCPEGSESLQGAGPCPIGHYCALGKRIPCPATTYCPIGGNAYPLPCPPGTFNAMIGQEECTPCPAGFICSGFGRLLPTLCPAGYVCSRDGLDSPNGRCPPGFYCPSGTITSDAFRNDTTLRPYPCKPGTYCVGGVGFDEVDPGRALYSRNCTEGFYCEAGSTSATGSGLCPRGFICPEGTSVPIPTSPGTFAEREGTVRAAYCLPEYYAPTIETVRCYPCPPGTQCANDASAEVTVCPPGTFRSADMLGSTVVCNGCPQGSWSRNWELRHESECAPCAPGVICPVDGMRHPCSRDDFPQPYVPTHRGESETQCLSQGENFYFGYLGCPIDSLGRGPVFHGQGGIAGTRVASTCDGYSMFGTQLSLEVELQCYENVQPLGSPVYQRMKDFHGPLYEIQSGGTFHQGYGSDQYEGYFGQGSLYIDHPVSPIYRSVLNCTPGYFFYNESTQVSEWLAGTCEADNICDVYAKREANACSEGYVCAERTTAINATIAPCEAGYVCDFGTTPDVSLEAPMGRYKELCREGFYCPVGTGKGQSLVKPCPAGYFCPTGLDNPYTGVLANDGLKRNLSTEDVNPFNDFLYNSTWDVVNFEPRPISRHDDRCFKGITSELQEQFRIKYDSDGVYDGFISLAVEYDLLCARDHKWRLIDDSIKRERCNCKLQAKRILEVYRLWKCTRAPVDIQQCSFDADSRYALDNARDLNASVDPFKVSFSYTDDEILLIESRNLCNLQLGLESSNQCNELTRAAERTCWAVLQRDFNISEGSHLELELQVTLQKCLCNSLPSPVEQETCRRFKLRNDESGVKQATRFRSYDDLKAFVYSIDENMLEEDHSQLLRLRLQRDYASIEIAPNPYESAFQAQLLNKITCHDQHTCNYIDSLLYDLWAAIKFIDEFGDRTPELIFFEPDGELHRLDTCNCQDLARCPDGTSSNIGASNIYKCGRTGSEAVVLSRVMPFDPAHPLVNMEGWQNTTELSNRAIQPYEDAAVFRGYHTSNVVGLGMLDIRHWEIVVATLDFTDLFRNLTYDLHYRLSVYVDCMPCAVRVICSFENTLPCCSCERYGLPYYFEDSSRQEPENYPDNKHSIIQVSLAAMKDLTLYFVLELLDGLYYGRFYDISPSSGELRSFTASRAWADDNDSPTEHQFLALITSDSLGGYELPLNLPFAMSGADLYAIEPKVFIDRIAQPEIGDPFYRAVSSGRRRAEVVSIDDLENLAGGFVRSESQYHPRDPSDRIFRTANWWEEVNTDFFATTYLPFFSNCREYDSHIFLSKLLEVHPAPHCIHRDANETIPVDPYNFFDYFANPGPYSDECKLPRDELNRRFPDGWCQGAVECSQKEESYPGMEMSCQYEETIYQNGAQLRWYEAAEGEALFFLTKFPMSYSSFYDEGSGQWGRTPALRELLGSDNLIPVEVEEGNASSTLLVPRHVELQMNYYQRTKKRKSLVSATLKFMDKCTISESQTEIESLAALDPPILPCSADDYDYVLSFRWFPLSWLDLMNNFEFGIDVYAIIFSGVGLVTIGVGFVIWFVSRVLTRLRSPPSFKFFGLFRLVAFPPLVGVVLATCPILTGVGLIKIWFLSIPNEVVTLGNFTGNWADTLSVSTENKATYLQGRIGAALISFGLYVVVYTTTLFVPKSFDENKMDDARILMNEDDPEVLMEEEFDEYVQSPYWKPRLWKRSHVILLTLVELLGLMIMWEFSYSASFEDWVIEIQLLYKLSKILIIEELLEYRLRDLLIVAPFSVVLEATIMIVTMGAEDFMDFVISYEFELGVLIVERLFIAPLQLYVFTLWPKWKLRVRHMFMPKRKMSREQRAREDAEWQKVNEEIALETEGVEPLLKSYASYATEVQALIMLPFINIFLIFYNKETQVPESYGIKSGDLLVYLLFSMLIILPTLAMDMFLLNTQELVQGWKIYDYVAYQQYRFNVREKRWQMESQTVDQSLLEPFRLIDNLCFSSQYYFLAGLHSWGMLLIMWGITIQLRNTYSMLSDPYIGIVCAIVILVCVLSKKLFIRLGKLLGVWKLQSIEGTVDDDIAGKLKVGEGRQDDLEQERLELQALNSERFRHRFLERNRPWILQHLVELLTPRTLQTDGADGRPNIEFIRDIYNDLINMGEGKRRSGDNSDISSDEEDDQEAMRRNWSNAPVSKSSAAIARWWLKKAKQRRALYLLIKGYMDKMVGTECMQCGRGENAGVTFSVELATDGKPDPKTLDYLIRGYEAMYPGRS